MRIALFATCIVDAMYPEVARDTVTVLERLGHEVVFPERQACCGQMHVNSGDFAGAVPVVEGHVRAFEDGPAWDVICAPSGSCAASAGHQQPMIARRAGDDDLASRAEDLAGRTYELSQLLTDVLGVTDAGEQLGSYFPHAVTYHPSCHGMRILHLGDRQRDLLSTVQDIDLRELPQADQCCGFGGTFSMKNSEVSTAMLADKADNIVTTGASLCTGGDASCLMHIGGGLSRTGARSPRGEVGTVHLARILASTREKPLLPPRSEPLLSGGSLR